MKKEISLKELRCLILRFPVLDTIIRTYFKTEEKRVTHAVKQLTRLMLLDAIEKIARFGGMLALIGVAARLMFDTNPISSAEHQRISGEVLISSLVIAGFIVSVLYLAERSAKKNNQSDWRRLREVISWLKEIGAFGRVSCQDTEDSLKSLVADYIRIKGRDLKEAQEDFYCDEDTTAMRNKLKARIQGFADCGLTLDGYKWGPYFG